MNNVHNAHIPDQLNIGRFANFSNREMYSTQIITKLTRWDHFQYFPG